MDRTHTGTAAPRTRDSLPLPRTQNEACAHHRVIGFVQDCGRVRPIASGGVVTESVVDARWGLEVRRVRNGRGLVAMRSFPAGARVMPILGRVVTARTVWRWWDSAPRRAANCFRLAGDRYLDPRGQLGTFANHGCRPNVRVVARGDRLAFEAIRAIRPGDEVLHDYATLLGADDVWTMRCRCGWAGCRGRVERFDRLPPRLLRDYQSIGAIPGYILWTAGRSTPSRR